jgi:hypothetical protein
MSASERAELFRTQVSGWLDRNRQGLTSAQVAILEEAMDLAIPELYTIPRGEMLDARFKDFERRAAELLSPEQRIEALTMQWGSACGRRAVEIRPR